jgi:hypothetical protein
MDTPVEPRPEFAQALGTQFLDEARSPVPVGRARARSVRLGWVRPRLRLAVLLIVLGLFLAGIATATYFGIRLAYETPPTTLGSGGEDAWFSFALAPGGHNLYAIRVPRANPAASSVGRHPGTPQLVRIEDVDRAGALEPSLVLDLDFRELGRPGFEVQSGWGGRLAAAANGDVFLVVPVQGHGPDTLFVIRPDGSRQRILDGSELIDANLFPATGGVNFGLAVSAPDRVWLWEDPWEGDSPQRLVEVVDPNADGDWSDSALRPIALPPSLPFAKRWQRTSWNSFPDWRWQLAAEPSLTDDDRSHSVLAAALSRETGELRVYRIGDLNDDRDALDPGEAKLVFDRHNGVPGQYPLDRASVPPQIASLVVREGGIARREIAVAGLTSPNRVSLISNSGAVSEVGPAFMNSTDWPANGLSVAANAQGDLYAIVATRSSRGLVWTIYELDPNARERSSR